MPIVPFGSHLGIPSEQIKFAHLLALLKGCRQLSRHSGPPHVSIEFFCNLDYLRGWLNGAITALGANLHVNTFPQMFLCPPRQGILMSKCVFPNEVFLNVFLGVN